MKNNIKTTFVLLFTLLIFAPVFAQQPMPAIEEKEPVKTEFPKEAITKFIEASKNIEAIQQKTEQEMLKIVEKENLEVDRFNEIAQSKQNPEAELDVTEKEMKSFETAIGHFQEIQEKMQNEMEQAIIEKNIEIDEYKEIMLAYQQNKEFQQKINLLMQQ
ncbi:MAG: DUF4168 domain-containing protein [Bacteroidetes bacterium]|nr:DUF4168 domain-containing protein [Bacteroidota bacterium]HET6245361.1 DUF4168 domain-containing protein [Bacteroidia bacterium]